MDQLNTFVVVFLMSVISVRADKLSVIGPLYDPVTWYKITHAGEQVAPWDLRNNATRTSPPGFAFVSEVPLRNLLTSMCDFVPCDRILQRAYCSQDIKQKKTVTSGK